MCKIVKIYEWMDLVHQDKLRTLGHFPNDCLSLLLDIFRSTTGVTKAVVCVILSVC